MICQTAPKSARFLVLHRSRGISSSSAWLVPSSPWYSSNMGIAGLARRLDPHATRHSADELSGSSAVVDGPSLAYHAHKLALGAVEKGNVSHIPSYAEIIHQALRWLRTLEDINIKVSTILFDGALPKTKQFERKRRLDFYNQQVNLLRSNYPSKACPIPTSLGSTSYAFLAPALREALRDSEFSQLTRAVPGESDDWCAVYANQHPKSVIFSDDTDLLLYNFPKEVRIIPFRDTELWPEPKFKGYYPPRICQDLELPNLATFAFCLTQDPHQTVSKLVQEANAVDQSSPSYTEFIARYINPSSTNDLLDTQWADPSFQNLDVRVSEFLHQILDPTSAHVIYLPFLVEDKDRASAWNVGQDLRTISYSLLAPNRTNVQELKRKAEKVTMQDITLYASQDLPAALQMYADSISSWIEWTAERQVPRNLVWPLYAVGMVLPELKTHPSFARLIRTLSSDFDNTWDSVHLSACLNSASYSLRMLQQCVSVWLFLHKDSSPKLIPSAIQLQTGLQSLGSIAELLLVPGQAKKPLGDQELLKELLAEIYASADVEVPVGYKSNRMVKKQRREAERKGRNKRQNDAREFNVLEFMNYARKN